MNAERDSCITLGQFFETFYRPRHPDLKPGSIEQYRIMLGHVKRFAGDIRLCDLTDDLAAGLISHLGMLGRSPHTINKTIAQLLAVWRYAVRKKFLDTADRPDVDKLRVSKRNPEAWTLQQFEQILSAGSQSRGQIGLGAEAVPSRLFWPAFLLLVYDCGLRRTPALALRIADVDLERGTILARAETQKQNADQVLGLSPQTIGAIRELVRAAPLREMLFPWPFKGMHPFTKAYRRLLKKAGLPSTRRDLIHRLRRTSATHLANVAGESFVQAHLGHSSPAVTRGYIDRRQMTHSMRASEMLPRPNQAECVDPVPDTLRRILAHDRITQRDISLAIRAMKVQQKEFIEMVNAIGHLSERHYYTIMGSSEPISDEMQAQFRAVLTARVEQGADPGAFDPHDEILGILAETSFSPESVRRAIRAMSLNQQQFALAIGVSEGYLAMALAGARSSSGRDGKEKAYGLTAPLESRIRKYLESRAIWLDGEGGAA